MDITSEDSRITINYLHGMDINDRLNNYYNRTILVHAFNFYQQMWDEYQVLSHENILLKFYIIGILINHLNVNGIPSTHGGDLNFEIMEYVYPTISRYSTQQLLSSIRTDFGIDLTHIVPEAELLSNDFQTEEEPAWIYNDIPLPPNLVIDYNQYYIDYNDDSDQEESDEPEPLHIGHIHYANEQTNPCIICDEYGAIPQLDPELLPGFCRVNCPGGHGFHIWCIQNWRKQQRNDGTYHTECPMCRSEIDTITMVPPPQPPPPPEENGFGKSKHRKLKRVNGEIKYLSKKG